MPVDVRALGCDFYAFSGHKLYGPTGIGASGRARELLEAMPPWQAGGDMIAVGALREDDLRGVAAALRGGDAGHRRRGRASAPRIDWLRRRSGSSASRATRRELLAYGTARLGGDPGLRLIGTPREKTGVLSFVLDAVHPHDLGTILDQEGDRDPRRPPLRAAADGALGLPATARASLGVYNTAADLDRLAEGVRKARGDVLAERRAPRALPDDDPRPQQAAAELPRARGARTARRAATTRSAATSSPCTSQLEDGVVVDAASRARAARSRRPRRRS